MSDNLTPNLIPASQRLKEQFNFTRIPNEIITHPTLPMQSKMIWIALWKYCFKADGRAVYPGMTRLAKDLGVSEDTIRKYRKPLEEGNLLEIKRRGQGKTNMYFLFVPSKPEPVVDPEGDRGLRPDDIPDKEDVSVIRQQQSNSKSKNNLELVPHLKFPEKTQQEKMDYLRAENSRIKNPERVGLLGDILLENKVNVKPFLDSVKREDDLESGKEMRAIYPDIARMTFEYPVDFLIDVFTDKKILWKQGAPWRNYFWGALKNIYPEWSAQQVQLEAKERKVNEGKMGEMFSGLIEKHGGDRWKDGEAPQTGDE